MRGLQGIPIQKLLNCEVQQGLPDPRENVFHFIFEDDGVVETNDFINDVGNALALEVAANLGESSDVLVKEAENLIGDFSNEGDNDFAEVSLQCVVVNIGPV